MCSTRNRGTLTPVRVEIVSARAGYGAREAVVDVSFVVEPGTVTVVLGPNGAGKSTLVRLIAGLVPLRSGSVKVGGLDVDRATRMQLASRVALVPQRTDGPVEFTVREVVSMGRAPHQRGWHRSSAEDERMVGEILDSCELLPLVQRPLADLSGGERQRVHVARALAQATPVLLLDEAAAHLDIRHSAAIHRLVRDHVVTRGLACVAAMHDFDAAARLADRVLLLSNGRVMAEGPVDLVMTPALLQQTFGVPVERHRRADGALTFSAA